MRCSTIFSSITCTQAGRQVDTEKQRKCYVKIKIIKANGKDGIIRTHIRRIKSQNVDIPTSEEGKNEHIQFSGFKATQSWHPRRCERVPMEEQLQLNTLDKFGRRTKKTSDFWGGLNLKKVTTSFGSLWLLSHRITSTSNFSGDTTSWTRRKRK